MIALLIMIISLILDGLLSNYLPYLVNDLSIYTPLFTLISIFIIYPLYRKKEKLYFIHIFSLGILYDLLYTNLLFFNGVLFIIIGLVIKYIVKNYELGFIKIILYMIIIITLYDKISHSLILNILYGEIMFLILKIIPKKYKEISIN